MNLVSVIIAAEDPTQSHHWLFPEIGEIIYGGLASLAIFFALYKFGWPAAKKALETRTAAIQKELDDSANARRQAETDAANIRKALGDVASERAKGLNARPKPSLPPRVGQFLHEARHRFVSVQPRSRHWLALPCRRLLP
ncbi:MAG: hypothetical protein EBZ98_00110 [Actinobacteria bacterium]|nr:hypothetical protein [Actinomycetota bacterium]